MIDLTCRSAASRRLVTPACVLLTVFNLVTTASPAHAETCIASQYGVGDGYEMTFCPRLSGDLYFMVNDMGLLYGNNSGSAKIEVADLGIRDIETAC